MKELWSAKLVKRQISDFLVDELVEQSLKQIPTEILNGLKHTVVAKADLKQLKEAIRSLKKYVDEDAIEYLQEEYDEIKDDLEWAATAKGKRILSVNDWSQGFFEEFRAMSQFSGIAIGAHTTKNAVFVAGTVLSSEGLEVLKRYIAAKTPPLAVLYDVKIGT